MSKLVSKIFRENSIPFREEPYSDYEMDRAFANIKVESPIRKLNAKSSSVVIDELVVFAD